MPVFWHSHRPYSLKSCHVNCYRTSVSAVRSRLGIGFGIARLFGCRVLRDSLLSILTFHVESEIWTTFQRLRLDRTFTSLCFRLWVIMKESSLIRLDCVRWLVNICLWFYFENEASQSLAHAVELPWPAVWASAEPSLSCVLLSVPARQQWTDRQTNQLTSFLSPPPSPYERKL